MEKDRPERKEEEFKFYQKDLEDIYLRTQKLPKSLKEDMFVWKKSNQFYYFLMNRFNEWLFEAKHHRINATAKVAHKIIDNLLIENVPDVFLQVYFSSLLKNRHQIEEDLQPKEAQKLFKFVPAFLVIDYIELFRLELTQKEKNDLIQQMTTNRDTCNQRLAKLPKLFKRVEFYADILINNLIKAKQFAVAGKIMKKMHIPAGDFPEVQQKLLENSARFMHKWEKEKFSWDMLEEVYGRFPSALACAIRQIESDRPTKAMLQGLGSIVHRIPQVEKYLNQKLLAKLKNFPALPNKLRNNEFAPSNKALYFSLSEFNYDQASIVWVGKDNVHECLEEMCKSQIIGIDTESTVARTALSTNITLLATVQIATPTKVFIYDAKQLRKIKLKSQVIQHFFENPNVLIVGHTLSGDLNGDVTSLFGFEGTIKCKTVDIVPVFKKNYPNKRAGLTFISEEILGKPICKQYTLTDWDRRPLYRNQIHYAALDAVIVLKIWEILKDKPQPEPEKPKEKKERRYPRKEGEKKGQIEEKPMKLDKQERVEQENHEETA